MKSPAFQFYPADFLVETAQLSNEEIGIYIRLLCYQWSFGHIPKDLKIISRLAACKSRELVGVLRKFEQDKDGNFFNQRLELERLKQNEFRDKQKANGLLGGRPKKTQRKPNGLLNGNPNHNPKKALQSSVFSLQSSNKESPTPLGADVVASWNQSGLPKIRLLTTKRLRCLHDRLSGEFWKESWQEAIGKIAGSDFCTGGGPTGWKADFDWFVRSDDQCAKAIEGKYDNKSRNEVNI